MYWKSDERGGVSVENFKIAKSSSRYSPSRLCGSLDDLEKHVATINRSKCTAECAVCGSPTYWKCGLCNKRICQGPGGKGCHIALHNDNMFGLIRSDFADVLGGKKHDWKPPTANEKRRNAKWIDYILQSMDKEE